MGKDITVGRVWFLVLLLLVAGAGLAAGSWIRMPPGRAVRVVLPQADVSNADGSSSSGFAPIAERAVPSVANVSSSRIVRSPDSGLSPFFNDPFFRDFFGDEFSRQFQVPRERRERSLGSAVIVSPDGYLLTNNHVVEGASDIQVTFADGDVQEATIVGTDPKTDIAVIRVDETGLPALPFGSSKTVRAGDFALAIGNPFGLGQTITFGIVSATGRSGLGIEEYEDFIQTDAAINPGNSGGALINVDGDLIGINTAIIGESGGNQGIGFAVPADMARNVMDQILEHGKVTRSWLGIVIQPVTEKEARAFGLKETRGILVSDVTPGSPAEAAGIERGDIILSADGVPVDDVSHFRLQIAMTPPGTTVALKLYRNEREIDLSAKLAEMPAAPPVQAPQEEPGPTSALGGLTVISLTPNDAVQLGLPRNARGAVITNVQPDSPSAEAGLRAGDVVQQVNRQKVESAADFERVVGSTSSPYVLLVNRGGTTVFVVVETD